MARNYELGLYKQLEELLNKINIQNHTINNLNETNKLILDELKSKDELLEKALAEIERLKNQINKDSNNSSKPSSTSNSSKKKTGVNLYNGRTKSGKSVGGQKGHKGTNLSKVKIEELISEGKIIVKNIYHDIKGNSGKEIIKYKLGIEVIPYVERHIFRTNPKCKNKLPKYFQSDVTYHNSIKSLVIELGIYNVISYERMSDFLSVITKNTINISNGTCVNFLREFSNKAQDTIDELKTELLNQKIIYTDETGAKFNKKNIHFRNYSNMDIAIYKARAKKGHDSIKSDNILTNFTGGIMGDHDTALYSYGNYNYECNVHLVRYFRELIENIPDTLWPFKMYELFNRMNNTRNLASCYGLYKFDKVKLAEYSEEFDNIMELAKSENSKIKSTFYKGKALQLFRRLRKYKKNHLYFIHNFDVAYSNNLSEQDLRIIKIKTKVCGGFRSFNVAECYADAISIIKTAIKRSINPFVAITSIFNKRNPFA